MIKLKKISKTYINNGHIVNALNNINLTFLENGLIFIVGESGSGKSTLLNILGGIDNPSSGYVQIDDQKFYNFDGPEGDEYRKNFIGFVFQSFNLLEFLNVEDNIRLSYLIKEGDLSKKEIDEILDKVGLGISNATKKAFNKRKINTLSGGEKQRVAIARALIKNPKVILADEPTGSLDKETAFQIFSLLKELSKEKLIIVVSHDEDYAKAFGDVTIIIKDGKILKNDLPKNKIESKVVKENDKTKNKFSFKSFFGSMKTYFKLIFLKLKKNIVLNLFIVLLSTLSLTCLGFASIALTYDTNNPQISLIYNDEREVIKLSSDRLENGTEYNSFFSDKKINIVDNNLGIGNYLKSYNMTKFQDFSWKLTVNSNGKERNLYFKSFENAVEINEKVDLEDFHITPDINLINKELCKMPTNYDEVAITDVLAYYYIINGFQDESGEFLTIKNPDDLIGKNFFGYKIVGIYSTENSLQDIKSESFLKSYDDKINDNIYANLSSYSMTGALFVNNGFIENLTGLKAYKIDNLFIKKPKNAEMLKKLLSDLSYSSLTGNYSFKANLRSIFYFKNRNIDLFTNILINIPILLEIICIILLIFTFLLFILLFMPVFSKNKYFNGVMRSLGAKKSLLFSLNLGEMSLLTLFSFGISSIIVTFYQVYFNLSTGITYYTFNALVIGLLFLFSVVIVVIVFVISLLLQLKDNSINLIKKGWN